MPSNLIAPSKITLSRILISSNRQRRSIAPGPLKELAESIRLRGLLHPIVVRSDPGDPDQYLLVCGERRLQAHHLLAESDPRFSEIAVTHFESMSELDQKEAELEENMLRVDLSWQEKALAVQELVKLRREQNPNISDRAVATEIAQVKGQSQHAAEALVSRSLTVGARMSDPKVASARSLNEAYNIASRDIEAELSVALAKKVSTQSLQTFIPGDAFQVMETLPNGSFDCILSDPPYGIGADDFGTAGSAHNYSDNPEFSFRLYSFILHRGFALCKSAAHLYLFCDPDKFLALRETAQSAGWLAWRTPIVIFKAGGSVGHDPLPGRGFRRSYEYILYAIKGDRPHRVFLPDVLEAPAVKNPVHAAQKPVELLRRLLERTCAPGDSALDPCCGSGAIFAAANLAHVRATGVEIDPAFATLAEARRFAKE